METGLKQLIWVRLLILLKLNSQEIFRQMENDFSFIGECMEMEKCIEP